MNKRLIFIAMLIITLVFGMSVFGQEQVAVSFPRTGTWSVVGSDSINWVADMVIDEINANNFSGYFEWRGGNNSSGREYFRGAFEPRTGKVSIQGYRLANDRGIGLGSYEAFLTRDNNDFISGTWSGGSWEGKWQKGGQVNVPFPRVGTWSLTGRDSGIWMADMVIDEINANSFSGYFEWRGGNNSGGREYFRGVYEPRTGKVSIQGYRLANDRGIGLGSYEAFLTGNDFRLGTWSGGGVWVARQE